MAEHDFLRIQDDEERGVVLLQFPIGGNWPPPDRVWMVCSAYDVANAVKTYAGWTAWVGTWEELQAATFNPDANCCVTELVRRSYSKISDEDAEGMTHVARGAVFSPVTDGDNS